MRLYNPPEDEYENAAPQPSQVFPGPYVYGTILLRVVEQPAKEVGNKVVLVGPVVLAG